MVHVFFLALMLESSLNSGHNVGLLTFPPLSRKFIVLGVDILTLFSIHMHKERQSRAWNKAPLLSADFKMPRVINFEMLKGIAACRVSASSVVPSFKQKLNVLNM